jgi:hypothetical protein
MDVSGVPGRPEVSPRIRPMMGVAVAYANYDPDAGGASARPVVDAKTLWGGGAAAAVVAALAYLVGVVIARGLLDVPVLAPKAAGTLGDGSTWSLALTAFAAGLIATALMHLLLVATPRPLAFFGWIVGLLTALAAVLPFMREAELSAQVATAVINLVVGAVIGSLISGVAARSVRVRPAAGQRPGRMPATGPGYTAPTRHVGPAPYTEPPQYGQPAPTDAQPNPYGQAHRPYDNPR